MWKLIWITPRLAESARIMSSVRLRGESQSARQEECEAMTGASLDCEYSAEGFVGDVRDVDHHAQAVHFDEPLRSRNR